MKTPYEVWRDRFLCLAITYSVISKDPSTKVGCVIVDNLNRPVGWGTNGFARTSSDSKKLFTTREEKYKRVLHAEENAIYNATSSVVGATAFLTHPPCLHCCHALAQNHIKGVVAIKPTGAFADRWNLEETEHELIDLGISFELVDSPDMSMMVDSFEQFKKLTNNEVI